MRCFYCMPTRCNDFNQPEEWSTVDEITQIVRVFAKLGVSRVRLTGGEPLVRKDILPMVRGINALDGICDISLSTNASLLSTYAEELYAAGVKRINVSLDTLQADIFKSITNSELQPVLDGLQAAKKAGFHPIKINTVVMRGKNIEDIDSIVDYCRENGFTLRFIETMPVGANGIDASQHYYSLQNLRANLQQKYQLIPTTEYGGGPARYDNIAGTDFKIGYITPISQHFCDTCNRVRLSATGTLYLCLGQENNVELGKLVRQGISDADLANIISQAIDKKPFEHTFNSQPVVRNMNITGG